MKKILITGGAGYIGGVTANLFYEEGYRVTVFDNLSTGHKHNLPKDVELVVGDLLDTTLLSELFMGRTFDTVVNFAAKIQVAESVEKPYEYLTNNTFGTLNLIKTALKARVKNFVLSSTAAVYGNPESIPIKESDLKSPINPYGLSKYLTEQILASYQSTHSLNWCALRYFNAAGAYNNIGPDYPFKTHLLPVAINKLMSNQSLDIYGDDYDTQDGTCIRDYVHVHDIAVAHLKAAELMFDQPLNQAINLGSGKGYSVLEVLKTLEKTAGQKIDYNFADRRPGDPAVLIASNDLAGKLLDWRPRKSIEQIVSDAWKWQSSNKTT